MIDTVICESCNKIIENSEAIDISDGEGIVMCKECYEKYTKYVAKKIQRHAIYGVLGNGKKTL